MGGGVLPLQVNPISISYVPTTHRSQKSNALLRLNPSVKLGCEEAQRVMQHAAYVVRC